MAVLQLGLFLLCLVVSSHGAARGSGSFQNAQSGSVTCPNGEDLKLVITGVNNETGHPRVQARLEQPAGREPWRLDVAFRDAPCPHGESRRMMQVTLHGPIQEDYLPTPQRLQQLRGGELSEIEILEASVSVAANETSTNTSWSDTLHPTRPNIDNPRDTDWELNEVTPQFEGFTKIAGLGRYKLQEEKANWTRASKICHREGATLALPNSQAEADALWQLKQTASAAPAQGAHGAFGLALAGMLNRALLVGARRLTPNANFTTIFGEQLNEAGYDTWAVPSTSESEGCVAMYEKIGFFAVGCEAELSFICELPL